MDDPDSKLNTTAKGRRLEDDVAALYRALGFVVEPRVLVGTKDVDVLVRKTVHGAPELVLQVECKNWEGTLSPGTVRDFIQETKGLVDNGLLSGGVMVAQRVSEKARAEARTKQWLTVYEYDELVDQLLTLPAAAAAVLDAYESSAVFPQYLSMAASESPWTQLGVAADAAEIEQLDDHLLRRYRAPQPPLTMVLADYGFGKTTLLRHLQYLALKEREDSDRLPIFVKLADASTAPSLVELAAGAFREQYRIPVDNDLFLQQLRRGKFLLLLDGFDEMVERSDLERKVELLLDLAPLWEAGSPAILSARLGYVSSPGELEAFVERLEASRSGTTPTTGITSEKASRGAGMRESLRAALWDRNANLADGKAALPEAPGAVRVAYLSPLDDHQFQAYLRKHDAEFADVLGAAPAAVEEYIRDVYDLSELAERPLLLKLIVDTLLSGKIDISRRGDEIGPAGLYDTYIRFKLEADIEKGESRALLSADHRLALAESVAVAMQLEGSLALDADQLLAKAREASPLPDELVEKLADLSPGELATEFLTCNFLEETKGEWRFSHKSFREFLVAQVIKNTMREQDSALLAGTSLSREVLYFLGGFAPTEGWVRDHLWRKFLGSDSDVEKRNYLVAFMYTSTAPPRRTLSDVVVWEAVFRNLTLERWSLARVEFHRLSFGRLKLNFSTVKSAVFLSSSIDELEIGGGSFAAELRECETRSISLTKTDFDIAVVGRRAAEIDLEDCYGRLQLWSASVGTINAKRAKAEVTFESPSPAKCVVGATDSRVVVSATEKTGIALSSSASIVCLDGRIDVESGSVSSTVVDATSHSQELDRLRVGDGSVVVGGRLDVRVLAESDGLYIGSRLRGEIDRVPGGVRGLFVRGSQDLTCVRAGLWTCSETWWANAWGGDVSTGRALGQALSSLRELVEAPRLGGVQDVLEKVTGALQQALDQEQL